MHIGFWIFVVVAISLVVGPLMMLRPDPVQKRKETWRAQARQRGIHFSMRNLPQQADQQEKPDAVSVYFFAPVDQKKDWMLLRTDYEHGLHFLGWWMWVGDARASEEELLFLTANLPQLPNAVKGVSVGQQGVCLYWNERGDDAAFQQVISFLESLLALQK